MALVCNLCGGNLALVRGSKTSTQRETETEDLVAFHQMPLALVALRLSSISTLLLFHFLTFLEFQVLLYSFVLTSMTLSCISVTCNLNNTYMLM